MSAWRPTGWPGQESREVEVPQVEHPDLEAIRALAFEMLHDVGMHFHEIAIRSPFEAESVFQGFGRRLTRLVGPPAGTRMYEFRHVENKPNPQASPDTAGGSNGE